MAHAAGGAAEGEAVEESRRVPTHKAALKVCFDQILAAAPAIDNICGQVFFAMVHLPYLQPFADLNKRASRLDANISLVQHNLGPRSNLLPILVIEDRNASQGETIALGVDQICRDHGKLLEAVAHPVSLHD
jgi:hypothetical protein